MTIKDRFLAFLGKEKATTKEISLTAEFLDSLQDYYLRKLAYEAAVNLIANTVGKCEFKTFTKGTEVRAAEYYAWNREPNQNQNASIFLHKLIHQMYSDQYEALVIQRAGQLLVADSFCYEPKAVAEIRFTDIVVDELEVNTYFRQRDALHFRPNNCNMKMIIDGLNTSYSKLMTTAAKDFQWKAGRHGSMKMGTMQQGGEEWQTNFNEYINNFAKPYLQNNNGVLPLFNGWEWNEAQQTSRVATTTRDIKALADDIFEFTAKGFGIPAALLKGDVADTDKAIESFLTFCIDPLCKQIETEINRKRYKYEGFLNGDYLRIDTSKVKYYGLFEQAANVDKLISSGVYCVNDILIAAGQEAIEEPWAWEHWITKNYVKIEEAANATSTEQA